MRTILIIAGVAVLLWLGYLTFHQNNTQLHLNKHDQQFHEVDNNFNSLDERYETRDGFLSEDNPIDETEDKFDQTEDKADQKIEMPYEQEETNENTNLKKDDNKFPKPNNKKEIDLKPKFNREEPMNDEVSLGLEDESVVAFLDVTDHLFKGKESIEAFELNQFQDDAITAFRVR